MRSPLPSFRGAMETAIRASTDLETAMGGQTRLYGTAAPANAALPYVVVTHVQVTGLFDGGCAEEPILTLTLDFWSRPVPFDKGAQSGAIGEALIAALDAELAIDGWDVDEHQVTNLSEFQDPDQSVHATLILEYLLTEQVA